MNQKRKEYEDSYSTPIKTWKALYGSTATLPSLPDFPTDIPDFGSSFSLDYLFPTLDLDGDGTTETETVQKALSNMWNRIHEEEEPTLVSSEISRFNTIISEYQTKLSTMSERAQQVLAKFTQKMNEFQAKFTTVMDVWTRYQASYAKSSELLNAEIVRLENDYQKPFFPRHNENKLKEEGSV